MYKAVFVGGLIGIGSLFQTGCTSIRSVMLHRDESNTTWEKERHLPGVPITLKVPTHLKVTVVEKHFLVANTIGGVQQVTRVSMPVPVRAVYHEAIYTEKIFTVDFKRPAAGTFDINATMQDNEQYFKQIQHKGEDKTLNEIANIISKVAPSGLFKPASEGGPDANGITTVESVVAVRVFEIDAPDLQQQLTAFLECHVNKAHDAWVVPPGVDEIRRLPLTVKPGEKYRDPLCSGPDCMQPGEQIETVSPAK